MLFVRARYSVVTMFSRESKHISNIMKTEENIVLGIQRITCKIVIAEYLATMKYYWFR